MVPQAHGDISPTPQLPRAPETGYNERMKIALFNVGPEEESFFRDAFPEHDIICVSEAPSQKTAAAARDADIISVFVDTSITKDVIDLFPQLKLIATRSTGTDHIDVPYAKTKGIMVANVPGYGTRSVAEFTFALMLAVSRKVVDASMRIRTAGQFEIKGLEGFDLADKTLGVIGTGKIGQHVVRIAASFDMRVLAYDVQPDETFAAEQHCAYVPLEELLRESDVVTLHVPYIQTTHHLMNAERIATMKKGAVLINTARGEIVDTDALVAALKSGHLAGAGLDVLEGERELKEEIAFGRTTQGEPDWKTLLEDQVLIDMPQVVVTPHIAFDSREARHEILQTTVENIRSCIAHQS